MKKPFSWALVPALVFCALSSPAFPAAAPPTTQSNRVQTGQPAPDFALDDQNGAQVKLSASRGKSPVVLVFYRGWW